jgi:catalase
MAKIVSAQTGAIKGSNGQSLDAEFNFENSRSTHFDAIIFAGGADSSYAKKLKTGRLIHAAREAFMHKKAIGATGNTVEWLADIALPGEFSAGVKTGGISLEKGVLIAPEVGTGAEFSKSFIDAVAKHRVWEREVDHIAA